MLLHGLFPYIFLPVCIKAYALPSSQHQPLAIRQNTDNPMDYFKNTFKGIYWQDAADSCGGDWFNILAETTRMLTPFTEIDEWRWYEGAAWNRFFVSPAKARGGRSWHVSARNILSGSSYVHTCPAVRSENHSPLQGQSTDSWNIHGFPTSDSV